SAIQHEAVRGTAIQPRTRELLAILGAHEDLEAVAMGPLQMAVYGTDGKTPDKVFEWSEPAPQSPTIPFNNLVSIGQSEVERILTRHQQYGCELEMGTRLVGITQDEQGVTAKVLRARMGERAYEEEIKCDYLIAADGAKGAYLILAILHRRSRKFIGVSFLGETKEADRMWVANVEVPGFSREYWHRWGDFATVATMLKPINTGTQFQIQSFGPDLPPEIPQDLTGMQQLFNSIAGRDDIRFTNIGWITEWRANIRMADKFSVGRVFLAGDAAHCHSPAGGQGTNTSMQDAFNLAWKLALVIKGKASPGLLTSYEAERMPVVAEKLNLSNELHAKTWRHMPDLPSTSGSAAEDPIRRSSKMLQLGVNYRSSTITLDERDNSKESSEKNPYGVLGDKVHAGDRAPYIGWLELQDGQVTDLFALLHDAPSHVALFFPSSIPTSTSDSIAQVQHLIDAELIYIAIICTETTSLDAKAKAVLYLGDPQALAAKAYNILEDRDVYIVVRPDGIVGAYTFGTKGILK
ncbi:FAD binding domain-containing protein, partial [Mycena crocata]